MIIEFSSIILCFTSAVGGKDGRRNEGSGEKENETRRDERRVKKQRAGDGQGAAERRW